MKRFISCFIRALLDSHIWPRSLTDEHKYFVNISGKQFLVKIMFHFDILWRRGGHVSP